MTKMYNALVPLQITTRPGKIRSTAVTYPKKHARYLPRNTGSGQVLQRLRRTSWRASSQRLITAPYLEDSRPVDGRVITACRLDKASEIASDKTACNQAPPVCNDKESQLEGQRHHCRWHHHHPHGHQDRGHDQINDQERQVDQKTNLKRA